MSPRLIHGRIVWATVPDPQGGNEKRRRCVVISSNNQIAAGGLIRIVGIASELTQSPEEHYVHLPYGRQSWSRLPDECAALGTWVIDIAPQLVEIDKGFIRPQFLEKLQDLVAQLEAEGYQIPLVEITD